MISRKHSLLLTGHFIKTSFVVSSRFFHLTMSNKSKLQPAARVAARKQDVWYVQLALGFMKALWSISKREFTSASAESIQTQWLFQLLIMTTCTHCRFRQA